MHRNDEKIDDEQSSDEGWDVCSIMSIRSAEKLCSAKGSPEELATGSALKKDIVEEGLPPTFGLLNRIVLLVFLVTSAVASAMLTWNLVKMKSLNQHFEFIYEASHAEKLYAALRIELRQFVNYANYGEVLTTETFSTYIQQSPLDFYREKMRDDLE